MWSGSPEAAGEERMGRRSQEDVEAGESLAFDGGFDVDAARRLAEWLARLPPRTPVHLDFSRVQRIEDRGLAALAAALSDVENRDGPGGPQLVFHGLCRHQIRLLRYFGVDAEPPAAPLLQ